jgi:hypothetical protein
VSNLRTLTQIVAPLVWGRVYAWGQARGRPALMYGVAPVFVALEWGVSMMCELS